jgi:hypothetical protein
MALQQATSELQVLGRSMDFYEHDLLRSCTAPRLNFIGDLYEQVTYRKSTTVCAAA